MSEDLKPGEESYSGIQGLRLLRFIAIDELRKISAGAGSATVHLRVDTMAIPESLLARFKSLHAKHLPSSEHEADEDTK